MAKYLQVTATLLFFDIVILVPKPSFLLNLTKEEKAIKGIMLCLLGGGITWV